MRFLQRFPAAATMLAAALLSAGCGTGDGTPNIPSGVIPDQNVSAPTQPTGTIRGHVLLNGDLPEPATDQISQDHATCGSEVALPRIAVGDDKGDKGIRDTFVFLEGVPAAENIRPAPATQTILIDQKNCQYVPHSLIVPFGSKVEMVNSDPIFHNVHGKQSGSGVFNMAQPQQGFRSTVDTKNMKPGIVALSCEAGHPWMSAFLYVTKDPYVALTGKGGEFVIKDVPPGTYTIKMWHEGVQLKKIHKALQQYEYEEPYEMTQQVTVTANAEATVNFELSLRK
jgi:plastocyanin